MSAILPPLHVETRGAGPDLVLLHGWALHGGAWGPWLDQLARHARLHIVDLPGHGRSPACAGDPSLAAMAEAVSLHVPRGAAVLGWSLGGMIALELARQRPADIAALILIASTPSFIARADWPDGMDPAVLGNFARGLASDYRRTIGNFLALQVRGDEHGNQALRALRASMERQGEPDCATLEAGLRLLRDTDLRGQLAAVTLPTLVIAGEYDRITPSAAARRLAALLRNARFVEIAKAGHAPFLSHPDAVLREVREFLLRHRGATIARMEIPDRSAAVHKGEASAASTLDTARVGASFNAAAARYDEAAVLQTRVRNELLDRLEMVRMQPRVVLDLGAGTGQGALTLKRRYPRSRVIATDLAPGMLQEAGRRQTWLRRFDRIVADAAALPLATGTIDMVFSSLMLQWCNDTDAVLRECRRVLSPGGVLTFTTLGPDTLVELRRSWLAADAGHAHVNRFLDMHDVGDALTRAGFAEPVLDVERYTLTYGSAMDLMRDLKIIGAHNANAGRRPGLTGKRTLARVIAAYEDYRRHGTLPATYEVVFGQAWCPVEPVRTRIPQGSREVYVPVTSIGKPNLDVARI